METRPKLFRAWDGLSMFHQEDQSPKSLKSFFRQHSDKNLMEFTGLNDSKGNKIFEGDFLFEDSENDLKTVYLVEGKRDGFWVDISLKNDGSQYELLADVLFDGEFSVFGNYFQTNILTNSPESHDPNI